MVITWYGQACFKIESGSTTIIVDPFSKKIGLNPPRGEANLLLVTHNHYDHNNISSIKGEPFLVDGPGEFEYGGVTVRGINSYHDTKEGEERGLNTIYSITVEDITIAHMGDIGQEKLTSEQINAMGEVDILMIPVGGVYTVDAHKAVELINQVEPKIVIPMHYKILGLNIKLAPVSEFLNEVGKKDSQAQDKLTIKKKALPIDKMEVVVLKV